MRKQTFILEIIENQNENWQGSVEWIQGGKKKCFRSILEMLTLLESAVPREGGGRKDS